MSPKHSWIWQQADWPHLWVDAQRIAADLALAHREWGVLEGKASAIGLQSQKFMLDAYADEVLATAEIEGQRLPVEAVRSSVMRRLGLMQAPSPHDKHVDGLVEMLDDASTSFDQALTEDRLCRWQSALFPGGTSGIQRIAVGRLREHADPMQIVSGMPGREVVHYEAPPSKKVKRELKQFLDWFAATRPAEPTPSTSGVDSIARAAIAHLWFESIHPFEDGNGRIGRAIVDMTLAQHLGRPLRLCSLSRQLMRSRKDYYHELNQAQRGACDVSLWVQWFARQWAMACRSAGLLIDQVILKRHFWDTHANSRLHERQRKVLQRLLDDGDGGFLGGLTAEKYMKMTGVSKATATRDLTQMVSAGQLRSYGAGKAVRYVVNVPEWTHGISVSAEA